MLAEIGEDHQGHWVRVRDKCDVVSRPYFTLTTPCVLHLSALVVDKSLGQKHAIQKCGALRGDLTQSLAELCFLVGIFSLVTWRHVCLWLPVYFSDVWSCYLLEPVGPICRYRLKEHLFRHKKQNFQLSCYYKTALLLKDDFDNFSSWFFDSRAKPAWNTKK